MNILQSFVLIQKEIPTKLITVKSSGKAPIRKKYKRKEKIPMIMFNCDYNEGAHPNIMKRLMDTNMEQHAGYSEDDYTKEACKLIKQACKSDNVDVHILVGGTQ